jgi:hypothetical protein
MFRSYDHQHVAVTEQNIQTSVALDGNPEPDEIENLRSVTIKFPNLGRKTTQKINKNPCPEPAS